MAKQEERGAHNFVMCKVCKIAKTYTSANFYISWGHICISCVKIIIKNKAKIAKATKLRAMRRKLIARQPSMTHDLCNLKYYKCVMPSKVKE